MLQALNDVCGYVELGLNSLQSEAEARRGLPWGEAKELAVQTGHMHCQATFNRRLP